jgi:type IV pilus biogenesis protein CpaD/CtpE
MKLITLAAASALAGLAGCADNAQVRMASDFGNAVNSNIAAQLVNPMPNYRTDMPLTDGRRVSDGIQRYRTNRVTPLIPPIESAVKEGAAASPVLAPPAER